MEKSQIGAEGLCLQYYGWEYCTPLHRFGPNRRQTYVLHIVREGRGTLTMRGRTYELGPGEAFLIPPREEAWYEADRKTPWFYTWIGFSGIRAGECAQSAGFTPDRPVRRLECWETISRYIEEMIAASQPTYANELRRGGLLLMVFADLIQEYRATPEGAAQRRAYPQAVYVEYALDYLRQNYNQRLRIEELAAHIGVTRSHLYSQFKKAAGCSPQEYLVRLRIEKARSLLKQTDLSVREIAAAVGYEDQLAFSKIFRQRTGKSPSEYREM
ncbi:MAG: helix-turn-helix domain-containing protein [Eubacteriales bacterium]|nr:helix-turn-helix domain-containing protein [Eubacteriales bacterium]